MPRRVRGAFVDVDRHERGAPAPITIRDFSLAPDAVPVGKVSTLTGSVTFDAPDADVTELAADVTLPSGAVQSLPRSDVPSAQGLKSGPLAVALLLGPPAPGAYVITLRLVAWDGGRRIR